MKLLTDRPQFQCIQQSFNQTPVRLSPNFPTEFYDTFRQKNGDLLNHLEAASNSRGAAVDCIEVYPGRALVHTRGDHQTLLFEVEWQ